MDAITDNLVDWNFVILVTGSDFYYKNNLKLVYFLINAQRCSVSDAARAIQRSRRIIYDKIIFNNPCLISEYSTGYTSKEGGRQRRIILSPLAKEYIPELKRLAKDRLGIDECHRLDGLAEKARRRSLRREKSKEQKLKQSLKILAKKYNDPRYSTFLKTRAKLCELTKEELDEKVKAVIQK